MVMASRLPISLVTGLLARYAAVLLFVSMVLVLLVDGWYDALLNGALTPRTCVSPRHKAQDDDGDDHPEGDHENAAQGHDEAGLPALWYLVHTCVFLVR